MQTLHFTQENLSLKLIRKYLEQYKDFNSIHQAPNNILPGMFYLSLLEPSIELPIKKIKIVFREIVKYPCELELKLEEVDDGDLKFDFFNERTNGKPVCTGILNYNDSQIISNQEKFRLMHQIPGALQKSFDRKGVYLKQTMEFKDSKKISEELDNRELNLAFRKTQSKPGREGVVKIEAWAYKKPPYTILAKGEAMVYTGPLTINY